MDDGEGREHGPTGPSTNATPSDIPPERKGGPEQSGCGCRRGPTASANEAHTGGDWDGGRDRRDRPRRDGGRIKQGDERCGRWGRLLTPPGDFRQKSSTTVSDFTPPRSDGRRGWRLKFPTLTGSDTPYRRCRDWGRDGLCGSQAKRLPSWPGPSASGWRLLLLHRARELRGLT